jgi:hypothetical protein
VRGPAFALVFLAGAASAAPVPGRYEATFCVTTSATQPTSCGPAEFELSSKARAEVRIADVVYRLHLRPAQVDVMTMQERIEIDEFSAAYEWQGNLLTFTDPDKKVRYEIRLAARMRGTH